MVLVHVGLSQVVFATGFHFMLKESTEKLVLYQVEQISCPTFNPFFFFFLCSVTLYPRVQNPGGKFRVLTDLVTDLVKSPEFESLVKIMTQSTDSLNF